MGIWNQIDPISDQWISGIQLNPFESSSIGWLGKTVKNLDPESKILVTAVSFGKGLPRALACPGVSVASVGALESYGLFTGVSGSKIEKFY